MKIKEYYKEKEYIHYSNCHEDFDLLNSYRRENDEKILSVASALDNSLALRAGGSDVTVEAFDYNVTQIYLCKLKKTAIAELERDEFLAFIGVTGGDSLCLYQKISPFLERETKKYFDEHIFLVKDIKLVYAGRFEYYLRTFSQKILPLVASKTRIKEFAESDDLEEQKRVYGKYIDNLRLKFLFKIFFSEAVMKRLGRDKEFFRYNKGSLSENLKRRFDTGVENVINGENPYINYALTGNYKALPFYLREENYYKIKKNIGNIGIHYATMDEMLARDKYDFINLSDVFEYLPQSSMSDYSEKMRSCLNESGRVAFWNMLNTRKLDLERINDESDLLKDKAFFYKDFLVYEK